MLYKDLPLNSIFKFRDTVGNYWSTKVKFVKITEDEALCIETNVIEELYPFDPVELLNEV